MTISQAASSESHTYRFRCNDYNPKGKVFPTTGMVFPNGKFRPLIIWETGSIGNPEKECKYVSERFDKFSDKGNLHFLKFTIYKKSNLTIVCGLSKQQKDDDCNESNKLFELLKAKDPREVLRGLSRSMVSDTDQSIFQNSGDESSKIVDFQAFIEQQAANR